MDLKSVNNKISVTEIAELALMCALMVIGKEALRMIPNVHPVALIIMLCVIRYGWKTIYPVIGFVILQIALYGFGIWTIMYFYVWPILVAVTMPFRHSNNRWVFAIIASLHGFTFGAFCSIPYIFTSGWTAAVAYWVAGLSFDAIHGVSNFIIVLLLLPPLRNKLNKISIR
ncbi:MAG: hypothetical protein MJ145_01745 [Clostridia bacterium]|nr:hypothetical protein [Clostridia bacterium]